jgi:CMP-N-acetylneuraminic acid synthetase
MYVPNRFGTCGDRILVSTDSEILADAARELGVAVVDRPAELASDTATVDAAARHAVTIANVQEPIIVILYANVPIRPNDLIDRAVNERVKTNADSVQSYCTVEKHHPYWMNRIDAQGRVSQFIENQVYRRQDLPELFIPDGGVIAVTRDSLMAGGARPHSFLGMDRRGIRTNPGDVIDIDSAIDLAVAEAIIERRHQRQNQPAGAAR